MLRHDGDPTPVRQLRFEDEVRREVERREELGERLRQQHEQQQSTSSSSSDWRQFGRAADAGPPANPFGPGNSTESAEPSGPSPAGNGTQQDDDNDEFEDADSIASLPVVYEHDSMKKNDCVYIEVSDDESVGTSDLESILSDPDDDYNLEGIWMPLEPPCVLTGLRSCTQVEEQLLRQKVAALHASLTLVSESTGHCLGGAGTDVPAGFPPRLC